MICQLKCDSLCHVKADGRHERLALTLQNALSVLVAKETFAGLCSLISCETIKQNPFSFVQ